MKRVLAVAVVLFSLASPASANLVDVSFDGSDGGVFSGLNTTMATYTVNVQIDNTVTGGLDDYQLIVALASTGGPINQTSSGTGIAVGTNISLGGSPGPDLDFIDGDETLSFTFLLTPIDTSVLTSFQFDSFDHGAVTSGGTGANAFGARVTDGTSSFDLSGSPSPTTDNAIINQFPGNSFTVEAFEAPLGFGTANGVAGISQITFSATAAPEPSSSLLCGLCMFGFGLRRRRRRRA